MVDHKMSPTSDDPAKASSQGRQRSPGLFAGLAEVGDSLWSSSVQQSILNGFCVVFHKVNLVYRELNKAVQDKQKLRDEAGALKSRVKDTKSSFNAVTAELVSRHLFLLHEYLIS